MPSLFEEVLSRLGGPALVAVFATAVWMRLENHGKDIQELWNGRNDHADRISHLEGRLDK